MESAIFQWNDNILVESGGIRWNLTNTKPSPNPTAYAATGCPPARRRATLHTRVHQTAGSPTQSLQAVLRIPGIVFSERRCNQTKPRETSPVIACDAGFTGLMPLRGGVHIKVTGIKTPQFQTRQSLQPESSQRRNDFYVFSVSGMWVNVPDTERNVVIPYCLITVTEKHAPLLSRPPAAAIMFFGQCTLKR